MNSTVGLTLVIICLSVLFGSNSNAMDRFPVAVVDTGLNIHDPRFKDVLCPTGHKDFTGEGLQDDYGHGTHVMGILTRAAPDHTRYCIVVIKAIGKNNNIKSVLRAIRHLTVSHIRLANFSISGDVESVEERDAIATSEVTFVVAAGNKNTYYKQSFPGGYGLPNVYPVGNWDCAKSKRGPQSNYGEGLQWRCGTNILSTLPGGKEGFLSGTSMAVPLFTAELINDHK